MLIPYGSGIKLLKIVFMPKHENENQNFKLLGPHTTIGRIFMTVYIFLFASFLGRRNYFQKFYSNYYEEIFMTVSLKFWVFVVIFMA